MNSSRLSNQRGKRLSARTLLVSVVLFPFAAHCADFDDDFSSAARLEEWSIRDKVEGGSQTFETIDVGKLRKGWLTIVPRSTNGWYRDSMGPMLFKLVEGDFLVETSVAAHSRNEPSRPPGAQYNSAGLIVRDPASRRGSQNWVVVNVGNQKRFVGSESKTTVDSESVLELKPGASKGRLRLARIGPTIYCLRRLDGESEWTLLKQYDRPDLPQRAQVGVMCNGWTQNADIVAEFDYVRLTVPTSEADLRSDRTAR